MNNSKKFICYVFKKRKSNLQQLKQDGTPLFFWMANPPIDYSKFVR
jgi:hypothetical protein